MEIKNIDIIKEMYAAVELLKKEIKDNNNNKYKINVSTCNDKDKLYFELNKDGVTLENKYYTDAWYYGTYTQKQVNKSDFNEFTFNITPNALDFCLECIKEDNKKIEENNKKILKQITEFKKELSFNKQVCLLKL